MSAVEELQNYARLVWGLRDFVRHPITPEQARAIVRQRIEGREANFLGTVEEAIFRHPRSPYLPLLKMAGCELGDLRNMVRARGLEGTLHALRDAGVYVTFEEFKGREPVVRQGLTLSVREDDFNNRCLRRYYRHLSGGSTGAPSRVNIDLDSLTAQAPWVLLSYQAHGVLHAPTAIWYGIHPSGVGINHVLNAARFGHYMDAWFAPPTSRDVKPSRKYRLATETLITFARLFGARIPRPMLVPLDGANVVAHWAAQQLRSSGACLIRAYVSMAVRVCLAARQEGLDLTGATVMGGGEPPTPAKVRAITQTGARWVPNYFLAEAGALGWGCANPADENDIHHFEDLTALIQHPCAVPNSDLMVDAFHFTSLLPSTPKVMLNVQSDDYGVIEERHCGCPLEDCAATKHLRHIRSFGKLTSEGTTLVGSDVVRILEEVLPGRFGGTPLDYQLLEEEDERGLTRLSILVHPRLDIADEQAVVETVLRALGGITVRTDMARATLRQAGALRVKRTPPVWTSRGKLLPLHLGRDSAEHGEVSPAPARDSLQGVNGGRTNAGNHPE